MSSRKMQNLATIDLFSLRKLVYSYGWMPCSEWYNEENIEMTV